jgi:GAF domain-containing protein
MFQEALTQRLGELAALYRFTEQLQVSKTLAEIYEAALTAITQALRCDRASILLCDHAGIMRFVAWRGLSEEYRPNMSADQSRNPLAVHGVPFYGRRHAGRRISESW